MPKPTFSLSSTGVDPKFTTTEVLDAAVQAVIDAIWSEIESVTIADTDALPEGATNLYHTATRVNALITAYLAANLDDTDALSEGATNLYHTATRVNALIEAYLSGNLAAVATSGEYSDLIGSPGYDYAPSYTGNGPVFPIVPGQNGAHILDYDKRSGAVRALSHRILTTAQMGQMTDLRADLVDGRMVLLGSEIGGIGFDYDTLTQRFNLVGLDPRAQPYLPPLTETHFSGAKLLMPWFGQSQFAEVDGLPLLFDAPTDPNLFMVPEGVFAGTNEINPAPVTSITSLVPMVEETQTSPVTPGALSLNTITQSNGGDPLARSIVGASFARGGARSDYLVKASPEGHYAEMMGYLTALHAYDPDYVPVSLKWANGEADAEIGTPKATVKANTASIQADFEADVNTLHGTSNRIPMVMLQTNKWSRTNQDIVEAQLDLAKQDDGRFYLADPLYPFEFEESGLHLTGYGRLQAAFSCADIDWHLLNGLKPPQFWGLGATWYGNRLEWKWKAPVYPLVLDARLLPMAQDFGFAIEDSAGIVPIKRVFVEWETVVFETNRKMTGTPEVRYAEDYTGAGMSIALRSGASGNLRDSSLRRAYVNGVLTPRPRWAPHDRATAYERKV